MRGRKNLIDELSPILLVLGVVANLAAIVTPLLPSAAPWMSLLFLVFAVLFWLFILYKRINTPHKARTAPVHLHSDWDATALVSSLSNAKISVIKPSLKILESLSLHLIIADRLDTGGWSKTQTWRFVRVKKPLSPVGTLTGTYFAFEALRPYGYLHSSEANHLKSKLSEIVMPDGRVKRQVQLTGTGITEIVSENLRHSSAWFLLRASTGDHPTPADRNCALRIAADLAGRLEVAESLKGLKEDKDMMGTAFATVALIAEEPWFQNRKPEHQELVRLSIKAFCKSNELSTPGHPSWGAEGGGSAAAETAAQWCTVWLLCSIADWHGLDSSLKYALSDQLLDLIEANIAAATTKDILLPYAFTRDASRTPIGESLLATAIACYASMILLGIQTQRADTERVERAIHDLLHRIIDRGIKYSTIDSLVEPYEGYLSWAALLFALRPILHPVALKATNFISEILSDTAINLGSNDLMLAHEKINFLYNEAGITLHPNGLMQDL
ncbi:MAG: hypothetical protein HZA77_01135 [Candidatus Schekmanbacteria bacterium]|nr:hypothetical protein [Candidatus Schekmanbacteria bacterium]